MRNTLRRIAFGVLTTGMVATMAMGASTTAASASVSARSTAAVADHHMKLIWPVVRLGDRGPRVIKVQLLLNQHGIRVKVDGRFDFKTKLAVKFFQKRHGIFPSGIVTARTWEALIVTVRKGSFGPAVAAVQFELRFVYGYKFVKVDGKFGQQTLWAVRLFQKRFHLFPDGVVGPRTWNALVIHEK
ncbi:MAG TPA: peptidoglycan-binding protein [Streptosporangiaceae bacterium]|nr:peptidoglycan-binding protein [Streptosporangiaceae bacterium]